MVKNGNAYERESRQMIFGIKDDIKEIKESILTISNHYSKRIPPVVALIISSLSGLLGISITLLAIFIRASLGGT